MPSLRTIAVLGLGRMGTAMAVRLVSLGWDVTGWTRSGRGVDVIKAAGDPSAAVANADVILLALFDGPACAEVVSRIQASLRPDATVVNTSTIAPAEAAALARQLGSPGPSSPSARSPRTWRCSPPPRAARCAARPSWPPARPARTRTSRWRPRPQRPH